MKKIIKSTFFFIKLQAFIKYIYIYMTGHAHKNILSLRLLLYPHFHPQVSLTNYRSFIVILNFMPIKIYKNILVL